MNCAVVGNVTIDVRGDEAPRLGGAALYGALALVELGRSPTLVTAAGAAVLDTVGSLSPDLRVSGLPTDRTTEFRHTGSGSERELRLLADAGPTPRFPAELFDLVVFAPVAGELSFARVPAKPARAVWTLGAQGYLRVARATGDIALVARTPPAVPLDAIVLSKSEAGFLKGWAGPGAVVVTDGPGAIEVREGPRTSFVEVVPAPLTDDVGAGDVFCAALSLGLAQGLGPHEAAASASRSVPTLLPEIHAQLENVRR